MRFCKLKDFALLPRYNIGMVFYVEDAVIYNFGFCFFVSVLSYRFSARKTSRCRALFSSLLAAASSLIYPLVNGTVSYVLFKAAGLVAASLILYANKQKFFSSLALLSLFDGTFFAALFAFGAVSPVLLGGGRIVYRFGGFSLIICTVCFVALFSVSCAINSLRMRGKFFCEAECVICGKKYILKTFLDTGNLTFDFSSGLGVVIVSELSLKGVGKSAYAGEIPFRSAGGDGVARLVYPEKFRCKNGGKTTEAEVAIGIVKQKFDGFDAIACPSVIGGNI